MAVPESLAKAVANASIESVSPIEGSDMTWGGSEKARYQVSKKTMKKACQIKGEPKSWGSKQSVSISIPKESGAKVRELEKRLLDQFEKKWGKKIVTRNEGVLERGDRALLKAKITEYTRWYKENEGKLERIEMPDLEGYYLTPTINAKGVWASNEKGGVSHQLVSAVLHEKEEIAEFE